jgi:uncharacterized tellurite resistance protein B-like protein/endogenous inhibitor of DNA gyrase (YacG/DUF329 family)
MAARLLAVTIPTVRKFGGKPGKKYVPLIAGAAGLFTAAAHALARAGGGEGYSGGGDGGGGGYGGGGGGGGGGLGWLIYAWVRFCIEYPYIGLPITLVVVFVVYKSHQGGMAVYQQGVLRRGGDAADDNRASEAAEAAQSVDANFNIDQFSQRIRVAFMKIQEAWCAQKLDSVWPFISDGVHERFSLQIDEQKAMGFQDHLENISVDDITLVEFAQGDVFDVATVRIDARAADWRASLKDQTRIAGSRVVEPFVEMWSWMRRHGMTRDPNKPGLIEGNCPNCGAAIEMNQSAQCPHCQAQLRSGEFDWVLTEITQQSEWRRGRHGLAAGTPEMRQRDPGFNRVEVEDRATVIFWRKALADRQGKTDALRKMAADEFCGAYAQTLRPQPDGSRAFFGDCAVGGAHLLGVEPGQTDDTAVVEMAWEGERTIIPAAAPMHRTGDRIQTHSLYILKRKSGVQSDPGKGVSSAHCPSCGAPIVSDTSSGCSFCGAVLNDGTRGWVLVAITSAASDEGRQWTSRFASPAAVAVGPLNNMSRKGVLAWTVKMVAADGTVDVAERELLRSLAERCHVESLRLDQMIEMALVGQLTVPDPPDRETALVWLTTMAATAMAQGRLRPQEAKILSRAAQRFGFTDADVNQLLRQQYAVQLATAKSELRTARARDGN